MKQSGHCWSVEDKDGGSHCNVIISLVAVDCSCLGLPVKRRQNWILLQIHSFH